MTAFVRIARGGRFVFLHGTGRLVARVCSFSPFFCRRLGLLNRSIWQWSCDSVRDAGAHVGDPCLAGLQINPWPFLTEVDEHRHAGRAGQAVLTLVPTNSNRMKKLRAFRG